MKTKKHIIVILSLLVIFSLPTYAHFLEEDSLGLSPESPILIYSVEDLRRIGNDKEWSLDKHYKLMNDIEFEEPEEGQSNWIPIGNNNNRFTGSFDGNMKNISGIVICDSETSTAGLIFSLQDGTVKNVWLRNIRISGLTLTSVSGLISTNINGIIDNCHVSGNLSTPESVSTGGTISAGLVAMNAGTILNSSTTGNIYGGSYVGGICGINLGFIEGCHSSISIFSGVVSGGIAAATYPSILDGAILSIKRCYTTGLIKGKELAGGIIGNIMGEILIQDCYSIATISVGPSFYGVWAGGIVAMSQENFKIERCYFKGELSFVGLTSYSYLGGIVGYCDIGTIQNCVSFYGGWILVDANYNKTEPQIDAGIAGNSYSKERFFINNITITSGGSTQSTKDLYEQLGWDFSGESPVWWFDEDTGFPQLVGVGRNMDSQ